MTSKVVHETSRLELTTWELGDFDEFAAIARDPEVMRFIANDEPWPDSRIGWFMGLQSAYQHGLGYCCWRMVLSLLTPDQRAKLDQSAELNKSQFDLFLQARGKLMRQLETALDGGIIDQSKITELGAEVGEIEAKMTWAQAVAMLDVRDSLSDEQSSQLLAMRAKYTGQEQVSSTENPFERGRQLYAQCALCHTSQSDRAIGPDLSGIVGRKIAADSKYKLYSPALRDFSNKQDAWTETQLNHFLRSPKSLVPGTIMGFDGFKSDADRAAIIAYLRDR